ncbi:MAG: TetR family transcriptional regulator [Planctomycetota bacterium]|nr:MAG: TetR family transcriptional regulator [Planctomycetota bacterium]
MQERAIKTKSKILTVAINEFSEKGYYGARIDDIAEKAQVNKQRIYAYYGNKEKLFTEVLKHSYDTVINAESFIKDFSEDDIPYLGEIILKEYIKFHESHPEFWRLLMWENLSEVKHLSALADLRSESMSAIALLYEKGQALGCFKKEVQFTSFIYTLTALSYFMFSNRYSMSTMFSVDYNDESNREHLVNDILKILSLPTRP